MFDRQRRKASHEVNLGSENAINHRKACPRFQQYSVIVTSTMGNNMAARECETSDAAVARVVDRTRPAPLYSTRFIFDFIVIRIRRVQLYISCEICIFIGFKLISLFLSQSLVRVYLLTYSAYFFIKTICICIVKMIIYTAHFSPFFFFFLSNSKSFSLLAATV